MNMLFRRIIFISAGIVLSASAVFLLRDILVYSIRLIAVSGAAALLLCPLCRFFEKHFSQGIAAAISIITAVICIILIASAVIIPVIHGFSAAIEMLSAFSYNLKPFISAFYKNSSMFSLPGDEDLMSLLRNTLPALFRRIISFAGGFADILAEIFITWYFLIGRKRTALYCELLIPQKFRSMIIKNISEAKLETGLFIKGQAVIAVCVGILSAVGLFVVGIPFAIPLGMTAGILNMIPYLGPIIACIPVGLVALSEGFLPLCFSIGVLLVVQQIDGLILSPRIVGNSTGFTPVVIMISVLGAGSAFGIPGMLFAVPGLILIRTCVRVFVELGHND